MVACRFSLVKRSSPSRLVIRSLTSASTSGGGSALVPGHRVNAAARLERDGPARPRPVPLARMGRTVTRDPRGPLARSAASTPSNTARRLVLLGPPDRGRHDRAQLPLQQVEHVQGGPAVLGHQVFAGGVEACAAAAAPRPPPGRRARTPPAGPPGCAPPGDPRAAAGWRRCASRLFSQPVAGARAAVGRDADVPLLAEDLPARCRALRTRRSAVPGSRWAPAPARRPS